MTKFCMHYMIVSSPEVGKHLIGVCKKCGREVDYTELQQKYPLLSKANYLTREELTMSTIMASLIGGKKTRGRPKKMEC